MTTTTTLQLVSVEIYTNGVLLDTVHGPGRNYLNLVAEELLSHDIAGKTPVSLKLNVRFRAFGQFIETKINKSFTW
jgi:hypothetical protein